MLKVHKADLIRAMVHLHACHQAQDWVANHEWDSVAAIWDSCQEPGWMAWLIHALTFRVCPSAGHVPPELCSALCRAEGALEMQVVPEEWFEVANNPLPWEEVDAWLFRPPPHVLDAMLANLRREYPADWVVARLTEHLEQLQATA
jgi:hypothetical protein